ncbi:MAG: hypothetical protein M1814_004919 [Vezdaea aestivalis]|nr:MAG: hypothetical protein M1814_004919 [Vezdaea aestivalis]
MSGDWINIPLPPTSAQDSDSDFPILAQVQHIEQMPSRQETEVQHRHELEASQALALEQSAALLVLTTKHDTLLTEARRIRTRLDGSRTHVTDLGTQLMVSQGQASASSSALRTADAEIRRAQADTTYLANLLQSERNRADDLHLTLTQIHSYAQDTRNRGAQEQMRHEEYRARVTAQFHQQTDDFNQALRVQWEEISSLLNRERQRVQREATVSMARFRESNQLELETLEESFEPFKAALDGYMAGEGSLTADVVWLKAQVKDKDREITNLLNVIQDLGSGTGSAYPGPSNAQAGPSNAQAGPSKPLFDSETRYELEPLPDEYLPPNMRKQREKIADRKGKGKDKQPMTSRELFLLENAPEMLSDWDTFEPLRESPLSDRALYLRKWLDATEGGKGKGKGNVYWDEGSQGEEEEEEEDETEEEDEDEDDEDGNDGPETHRPSSSGSDSDPDFVLSSNSGSGSGSGSSSNSDSNSAPGSNPPPAPVVNPTQTANSYSASDSGPRPDLHSNSRASSNRTVGSRAYASAPECSYKPHLSPYPKAIPNHKRPANPDSASTSDYDTDSDFGSFMDHKLYLANRAKALFDHGGYRSHPGASIGPAPVPDKTNWVSDLSPWQGIPGKDYGPYAAAVQGGNAGGCEESRETPSRDTEEQRDDEPEVPRYHDNESTPLGFADASDRDMVERGIARVTTELITMMADDE